MTVKVSESLPGTKESRPWKSEAIKRRGSKSVDPHVRELVDEGVLQKLQNGLYYYPKASVFGQADLPTSMEASNS